MSAIGDPACIGKLNQALDLKHRRIRTEAAFRARQAWRAAWNRCVGGNGDRSRRPNTVNRIR